MRRPASLHQAARTVDGQAPKQCPAAQRVRTHGQAPSSVPQHKDHDHASTGRRTSASSCCRPGCWTRSSPWARCPSRRRGSSGRRHRRPEQHRRGWYAGGQGHQWQACRLDSRPRGTAAIMSSALGSSDPSGQERVNRVHATALRPPDRGRHRSMCQGSYARPAPRPAVCRPRPQAAAGGPVAAWRSMGSTSCCRWAWPWRLLAICGPPTRARIREQAGNIPIRSRAEAACRSAPIDFGNLVGDLSGWAKEFDDGYNAVSTRTGNCPSHGTCTCSHGPARCCYGYTR